MHTLMRPNDTELKLDLQKYEDFLTTLNIIIARENAKMDLKKKSPEFVTVEAGKGSVLRLIVNCDKIQEASLQPNSPESKKPPVVNNGSDLESKFKLEKIPKHIGTLYIYYKI